MNLTIKERHVKAVMAREYVTIILIFKLGCAWWPKISHDSPVYIPCNPKPPFKSFLELCRIIPDDGWDFDIAQLRAKKGWNRSLLIPIFCSEEDSWFCWKTPFGSLVNQQFINGSNISCMEQDRKKVCQLMKSLYARTLIWLWIPYRHVPPYSELAVGHLRQFRSSEPRWVCTDYGSPDYCSSAAAMTCWSYTALQDTDNLSVTCYVWPTRHNRRSVTSQRNAHVEPSAVGVRCINWHDTGIEAQQKIRTTNRCNDTRRSLK